MSTTVSEVLTAARDSNPEFHARAIPDKVALRALHRIEKRLVEKAIEADPDALMTDNVGSEITVGNNAAKAAGYTLPAALKYGDMYVNYTAGTDPPRRTLTILDGANRGRALVNPAAKIEGYKLFPLDPNGENWGDEDTRYYWEDASSIEVHYVADITEYTSVDDVIQTNDTIFDALVEALTAWMGKRLLRAIGAQEYAVLKQDAMDAEMAWLENIAGTAEHAVRYVRVVN